MRENIYVQDIDADTNAQNHEDMNTNENSARELSRKLRKSKSVINRMVIYGNYIRNALFHREPKQPNPREHIEHEIVQNPIVANINRRILPLKFKVILILILLSVLILISVGIYLVEMEMKSQLDMRILLPD